MKDHVEGTHMNSADGEKVEFKNIIRLEGVIEVGLWIRGSDGYERSGENDSLLLVNGVWKGGVGGGVHEALGKGGN